MCFALWENGLRKKNKSVCTSSYLDIENLQRSNPARFEPAFLSSEDSETPKTSTAPTRHTISREHWTFNVDFVNLMLYIRKSVFIFFTQLSPLTYCVIMTKLNVAPRVIRKTFVLDLLFSNISTKLSTMFHRT